MKRYLFLLSLILSANFINSQDLIVTYADDSLNVKIDKILSDRISYSEGSLKTTIASRDVKTFQKGFYNEVAKNTTNVKREGPIFHFGVDGGWSYRTAAVPPNSNDFLKEYYRNIKSGYSYGLTFGLFASDEVALGLTINQHRSVVEYDNIVIKYLDQSGNTQYFSGRVKDDITIAYYAPTIFYKFSNYPETINFLLAGSIGFNTYRNVGWAPFPVDGNKFEMSSFSMKGSSIGLGTSFSADIKLNKYFYIGPQIGIYTGALSRISVTTKHGTFIMEAQNPQDAESLVRINLGGNLRVYF